MSNIEIEAKLRLPDAAALHEKLDELNAVRDRQIHETNTYFDLPEGRLKSTDQGLRIRVERETPGNTTRAVITHKGPRTHGKFKSRTETETVVEDARAAETLLVALGYQRMLSFEKQRTRYLLDDCRVEIDTLPYLGTFVEIEGHRDEAVTRVLERLGLSDEPLIRASYVAMLTTHLQEQGIRETHVPLRQAATAGA